ncbi:MAG: MFS transporter [Smithellaceae bacterium]|nr:MFS transporter [Smithellaceae bacterium]
MQDTKYRVHYGYIVAAMSVMVVLGSLGLGRFSFTMIYPNMMEGLGVGNTEMGLLASINFFGYLIFSLAGGIMASKYGPRVIISFSLIMAGIAMVLTGLAGALGMAMAMRFITGMGSGGSNVPVMGLLSSWFAPRRRGMAAGLAVGGSGIGIALAGILVPMINGAYHDDGWRWSWYFLGAAVVAIGLLAAVFLRNSPDEMGIRPVAFTEIASGQQPGVPAVLPFNWRLIYRSREIWQLGLLYFLFGFSYIIMINFFSVYLIREAGLPERTAGYLWSTVGLLGIFSGLVWGNISDLIGRRLALSMVFALQGTCFAIFALGHGPFFHWSTALLFGITAFAIPAIIAAATGDFIGARLAPAGLGMITVLFGIGQMLGPALAGYLADLTGTYRIGFFLSSGAAFTGALGSLMLKPPKEAAN